MILGNDKKKVHCLKKSLKSTKSRNYEKKYDVATLQRAYRCTWVRIGWPVLPESQTLSWPTCTSLLYFSAYKWYNIRLTPILPHPPFCAQYSPIQVYLNFTLTIFIIHTILDFYTILYHFIPEVIMGRVQGQFEDITDMT